MMTLHRMSLQVVPFALIKDGRKQIELRLDDAKRKLVMVGDRILFTRADDAADFVETEVVALLRYDSFSNLIDDLPLEWFGGQLKDDLKAGVYQYYSVGDELRYGVLGIRLKLL